MMEIKNDDEYLKELLKLSENETLDFKQGINKSSRIAKTLIAFANTKGGKIAVGISDKKKLTGIDPEEEIFMLEKANKEYCSPPIQMSNTVYETNGLDDPKSETEIYILIVDIPKSEEKHYFINPDQTLMAYTRVKDKSLPTTSTN
ncbi:AlbA family DNA-binding domain-containing protein [Fontibacter flavus]|uniref:Helix-turn-helix domain-containing protein n=1 Tax=Fontibacter flavus TaxID=654838 RepID=A0ABV6FQK8_9BACT